MRPRRSGIELGWVAGIVLVALAVFAPPDGAERAAAAQFAGRFHPVVVHLPIALILLVPLLEFAGRKPWRAALRDAAGYLLGLSVLFSCLGAALGYSLARSGGYEGDLLESHMWGGLALYFGCLVAWTLRNRGNRSAYLVVLALTLGVTVFTGHRGGQLTHGENYLLEHAPWTEPPPPAAIAFPTDKAIADWEIYAHVVSPILQARCQQCHNARNAKGSLAVDHWDALLKGGKNGPALVAKSPEKSLLLQRMNLPAEHSEHMPPRRKPQPTPEEMALLRRWIALGAPQTGTLASVKLDNRLLAVAAQLPDLLRQKSAAATSDSAESGPDPAIVAKERAQLATHVERLQAAYPSALSYESRQSANLALNASSLGTAFGDAELSAFLPVAGRIVRADLSGSGVTDKSASTLGAMKQLAALRLAHTAVTDQTTAALGSLEKLESLSLFGSGVTPATLSSLERLRSLRRVYLGETSISANTPAPESLRPKLFFEAAESR